MPPGSEDVGPSLHRARPDQDRLPRFLRYRCARPAFWDPFPLRRGRSSVVAGLQAVVWPTLIVVEQALAQELKNSTTGVAYRGHRPFGGHPESPRSAIYARNPEGIGMPIYSILHRWTRSTVAVIEAPTYARALEWAARRGLSLIDVDLEGLVLRSAFLARADFRGAGLTGADLSGCYLRKADLRGADLRRTRLVHAFLGGSDLRQADLREAVLSRADLRGTKLVGADLRGTVITGSRLTGALCDWRWSVIPAELLRQNPRASGEDSRLVIELAFYEDQRPWGWLKLLSGYDKRADWALDALAESVRDGDNAPEMLRCLATDASSSSQFPGQTDLADNCQPATGHSRTAPADIPSVPRMLWTCRRTTDLGATRTLPDP